MTVFFANFNAPTILTNDLIPCGIFVEAVGTDAGPIPGGQGYATFKLKGNVSPPGDPSS